jgi:hypothetical protein
MTYLLCFPEPSMGDPCSSDVNCPENAVCDGGICVCSGTYLASRGVCHKGLNYSYTVNGELISVVLISICLSSRIFSVKLKLLSFCKCYTISLELSLDLTLKIKQPQLEQIENPQTFSNTTYR